MKATVTRTVPAPVEKVWAVLADHEGMSAWAPGLKASLVKEGDEDRNGRGAVRRISPAVLPAIVEEITAFEPNARLSYRAIAGVPLRNYHGDVELTPSGSGTRIAYSVSADPRVPVVEGLLVRGIAAGLLSALIRAVARG